MAWRAGDWLLAAGATGAGAAGVYVGARALRARAGTSTGTSAGTSGPGPNAGAALPAGLPAHPADGQRVTLADGQCWQYNPAIAPWTAAQISRVRSDWQANIAAAEARGMSAAMAYETYGTASQLQTALAQVAAGTPAGWHRCVVVVPAGVAHTG